MKGWSPFDKKHEDKDTIVERTKDRKFMDKVYKALDESGKLQDTGGYSARELAAMTEKERAGNINDYEPDSFNKMVQEMKEKLSK
tara:strand:- start:1072 stop:1326 length:255 start_codon:yes stop_codon:yes gene_type:complete